MFQINRSDKYIKMEDIQEFAGYGTALISDVMGRYGVMLGIHPIAKGMKLLGPAVTVQTYRCDNLMIHAAIELARENDVIVVDAGGITTTGMWGGFMTEMAMIKKLGGVVVDGAVRDSEETIEKGFNVFSKAICPQGSNKNDPGSVNVPIACGNVVVKPGDIIVGDDDGVVVIPLEKLEEVRMKCRAIAAKEQVNAKALKEGKTLFELLGTGKQLEAMGLKMPE